MDDLETVQGMKTGEYDLRSMDKDELVKSAESNESWRRSTYC